MPPRTSTLTTRCVVAGGGPGGMMLGYLLARAGVDVVVLEKHADFLRDFRGDTIHPSTLEVIRELGLMDRFRPLAAERDPRGWTSSCPVTGSPWWTSPRCGCRTPSSG